MIVTTIRRLSGRQLRGDQVQSQVECELMVVDEAGPKPKSPKKSASKKTEDENEEKEHENGVDGEEKPVVKKRKAPVAENGELHSPTKKRGKKADDKKSDVEEAAKPSRKRKAGTDESTHSKESSPTKLKFPVKEKSPAKEESPSKEKSPSKERPPTKGDVLIPESSTDEVVAEKADEVIADAEIIASDDSPAKKSRGRPKKEKSTTEATTEDGEKRGRGRPKKEKSGVEPTENGEKRARGRPKKEKSGATSDDNDTAVKKGSGKPKDGDEAIKKGRGRPKKDVVA